MIAFNSRLKMQIIEILEVALYKRLDVWRRFAYQLSGIVTIGQIIRTTMNMDEESQPNTPVTASKVDLSKASATRKELANKFLIVLCSQEYCSLFGECCRSIFIQNMQKSMMI